MRNRNLSENQAKTYHEMLNHYGESGLYQRTVNQGIMRIAANVKSPDVELLDLSDEFFILYRRSGEEAFLTIGKVLRRSAHALYRQLLRTNNKRKNSRFLHIV